MKRLWLIKAASVGWCSIECLPVDLPMSTMICMHAWIKHIILLPIYSSKLMHENVHAQTEKWRKESEPLIRWCPVLYFSFWNYRESKLLGRIMYFQYIFEWILLKMTLCLEELTFLPKSSLSWKPFWHVSLHTRSCHSAATFLLFDAWNGHETIF